MFGNNRSKSERYSPRLSHANVSEQISSRITEQPIPEPHHVTHNNNASVFVMIALIEWFWFLEMGRNLWLAVR